MPHKSCEQKLANESLRRFETPSTFQEPEASCSVRLRRGAPSLEERFELADVRSLPRTSQS